MALASTATTELMAGIAASYERSKRLDRSFNYEKVFWNSAFSLGIVGAVWLSVKAGQTIKGLQDPIGTASKTIEKAVNGVKIEWREHVYSYVEGENKNKSLAGVPLGAAISVYRNNPDEWEKTKEAWSAGESPSGAGEEPPDFLDTIDEIYADWGDIMPTGVVLLQIALEVNRVKSARDEYDQLERELKA